MEIKLSRKEFERRRERKQLDGDEEVYSQEDWMEDQQDPDNWMRIPEFGVHPFDVKFEGFAFSIVEPGMNDYSAATAIRRMLATGRKKMRALFATRAEMFQMGQVAIAKDFDCDRKELLAFMAVAFERTLEDSMTMHDMRPEFRFGKLAEAGSQLALLLSEDLGAIVALQEVTNGRRRGGKKSGENRQLQSKYKKAEIVAAARAKGWPENKRLHYKLLASDFNLSEAYIGEILRDAKKKLG